MAYERHLRDVLALHKPRNDFDVAATASTAGVVSANTGPFSRLRSAAGPAIRLQMSAARALLESHCMARTCTICSHPKLVNIDRQLLRGDMLNGIAHPLDLVRSGPFEPFTSVHVGSYAADI